MRRNTFIACAGILTLWLGGCATGPDTTTTEVSPAPDAAASPVAVAPTAAPAAQPFAQPTVTASPAGTLPPDLISSTDPNQRVREIDSNRADPFALVPTRPIVEAVPVAQAPQSVPTLPSLPNNAPSSNRPSSPSGTLTPLPALPNLPSGAPLPPPPPQPDLARQVAVTGVVQIGNTVHAIVKAPNEPTSRYVRAGQLLSNGQVLVKRIEMNPGGDPVVVLEQYGIEVVVAVGEGGPPATGTPTAAIAQPRA